jgi:hypothetical protein
MQLIQHGLTNKTMTDSSTWHQDDTDILKLQLELSGITTTRTLTVPDANITLVGTIADQTLTNKMTVQPIIL